MEYLIENEVIDRIKKTFPLPVLYHKMIRTFGIGESFLADIIKEWEDNLPSQFKLAYLPTMGEVKLRLTASGPDLQVLEKEADKLVKQLELLAGKYIYGFGDDTLESKIGEILYNRGLTISTAESCTGGHLAHTLTTVPGSSRYYRGSIIAYHNEVKKEMLNVPEIVLQQHGAVSEETVRCMAENVREKLNSDIGLATSGIAGPDGGTVEKPVGTVWLAYSDKNGTEARKIQLMKDRVFNIQYSSRAMLIFLYKKLKGDN
jgi:nicotinamide-nucleotide amidase